MLEIKVIVIDQIILFFANPKNILILITLLFLLEQLFWMGYLIQSVIEQKKKLYQYLIPIFLIIDGVILLSFYKMGSFIQYIHARGNDIVMIAYLFLLAISFLFPVCYVIVSFFQKKRVGNRWFHLNVDQQRRKIIQQSAISSIALSGIGAIAGWNILSERENLEVNRISLSFNELPEIFHGIKLVHLTDIHASPYIRIDYLKKVVEQVQKISGDFLILTGDYITGSREYFPEMVEAFSQLKSYPNRIAVLGNHDMDFPDMVEKGLTSLGFEVLQNRNIRITRNNHHLYFAGVMDLWSGQTNINLANEGIPDNHFKILLCHQPDLIKTAAKFNYHLMLSGHTHGGQIQIPLIGPLVVPSRYGTKYAEGLFQEGMTYLYVNKGVGLIPPPVRVSCRPEIAVITLNRLKIN